VNKHSITTIENFVSNIIISVTAGTHRAKLQRKIEYYFWHTNWYNVKTPCKIEIATKDKVNIAHFFK